jgi:hypothetical protein
MSAENVPACRVDPALHQVLRELCTNHPPQQPQEGRTRHQYDAVEVAATSAALKNATRAVGIEIAIVQSCQRVFEFPGHATHAAPIKPVEESCSALIGHDNTRRHRGYSALPFGRA